MTRIKFILLPVLIIGLPFFTYAIQRFIYYKDCYEPVLMGMSAQVSLALCLSVSAYKIKKQSLTNDLLHAIMMTVFATLLFGLIFMIFEPLQRVSLYPTNLTLDDFAQLYSMLVLMVLMIMFYFIFPAAVLVWWWGIPLYLKWLRLYRETLKKQKWGQDWT